MKIWRLNLAVNDYESFWSPEKISISEQRTFDGRSKIDNWKTIKAAKIHPNETRPIPNAADFYTLIPAFDSTALETLGNLMKGAIEILPIEFEDTIWNGIYVTKILDAINHEKAKPVRLSSGKIIRFEKYAFLLDVVQGHHIFRISDKRLSFVFVSDEFKKCAETAELTGFNFECVWDSEI